MLDQFELGEVLAGTWNLLLLGGGIVTWAMVLGKRSIPLRQAGPPPVWKLSSTDLIFVLGMALMIYAILLVLLTEVPRLFLSPVEGEDAPPEGEDGSGIGEWRFFFSAVSFQLGILLGLFLLLTIFPQMFQSQRVSPVPPLRVREAALWGITGLLLAFPLVVVSSLIWQTFLRLAGMEIEFQEVVNRLMSIESHLLFLLTPLSVAILAPLWEEIVFRAGLFRLLHNRLSFWVAAMLSGAIFAAVHASLPQLAALFVLGVMLAYVYQKSGSLLAVIFLHGFFNLNTIVVISLLRFGGSPIGG